MKGYLYEFKGIALSNLCGEMGCKMTPKNPPYHNNNLKVIWDAIDYGYISKIQNCYNVDIYPMWCSYLAAE